MDESDFSIFGKKKQDKADATPTTSNKERPRFLDISESKKAVIVSRPTTQDTYNDCQYAGIAVILNHKDVKNHKTRNGTEKDRDAIKKSLSNYGFDVRVYNDLAFADINDTLKSIASEDHSQNDCFILVVMSHGSEGKVYASDMSYPVERLWNPFLGENCKTLINKPKLFFIQACRGENLEKAVVYTQSEFAPMSRELNLMAIPEKPVVLTYAIPTTADLLIMYSTFEKYFSYRNVENGSWFIQTLCIVLDEAAKTEIIDGAEIYRLLTTINRRVAYEYQTNAANTALNNMKEMPNFQSTLTKMFYLKVKPKNIEN